MPVLNIPEELIELRSSLKQFIDREVRPVEEQHRQEIQETGTFEAVKDEALKLRKRSAEVGFYGIHMPEEVAVPLRPIQDREAKRGEGSSRTKK